MRQTDISGNSVKYPFQLITHLALATPSEEGGKADDSTFYTLRITSHVSRIMLHLSTSPPHRL